MWYVLNVLPRDLYVKNNWSFRENLVYELSCLNTSLYE